MIFHSAQWRQLASYNLRTVEERPLQFQLERRRIYFLPDDCLGFPHCTIAWRRGQLWFTDRAPCACGYVFFCTNSSRSRIVFGCVSLTLHVPLPRSTGDFITQDASFSFCRACFRIVNNVLNARTRTKLSRLCHFLVFIAGHLPWLAHTVD